MYVCVYVDVREVVSTFRFFNYTFLLFLKIKEMLVLLGIDHLVHFLCVCLYMCLYEQYFLHAYDHECVCVFL